MTPTPKPVWPVFEFRPLPEIARDPELLRYADGKWIKDDGEFDVAFATRWMAFYVDLPYQRNIVWSACQHWQGSCAEHPNGNPWHYMLHKGENKWGGDWGRDRHLNTTVGRAAMSFVSSRDGCSNGRGPEFKSGCPYVEAGLVREVVSKTVVCRPERFVCMYCGELDYADIAPKVPQ